MSSHGSESSRLPALSSDNLIPSAEMLKKRRFTVTTDDGLFFVPGEYRLSGESNCYPWVQVQAGMCIVTHNTGFAPGTYDVKGTVQYDTREELMAADPKFASKHWSRLGDTGEHYSGRVDCEPVELMGPPVKMIQGVDDPRATDPHTTHEYHMSGFTLVKKRRTDVPGLTLVVSEKLPVRQKYHVEGRVLCQVGSTEMHGLSLISLRRTNVGRFRLNGRIHLSLSTDADDISLPPSIPPPAHPDEALADDQGDTGGRPLGDRVRPGSCRCRPFTR